MVGNVAVYEYLCGFTLHNHINAKKNRFKNSKMVYHY